MHLQIEYSSNNHQIFEENTNIQRKALNSNTPSPQPQKSDLLRKT